GPNAIRSTSVTVSTSASTVSITVLSSDANVASNLIDEAVLESPVTGLAVNALVVALINNTVVTVPDVDYPVLLRAKATVTHSATNANVSVGIVPEGGNIGTI